jgi:hypothetical protein
MAEKNTAQFIIKSTVFDKHKAPFNTYHGAKNPTKEFFLAVIKE